MADKKNDDDDKKDLGGKAADLFFKSRNVIITGEINDKLAQRITTQLIALAEDSDKPINLFISSPGGHVESGDMVHDMIKFIKPEVRTIGSGWVASAGALIFVGAQKKNRFCLPNTRFLLHQPSGGAGGQATDIRIEAEEILKVRERLNALIAAETGQPVERVAKDSARNYWMDAGQAREYGLVSRVLTRGSEID